MAKVRTIQSSYVNGALDEKLLGRVDNEIYSKGALELENVYVSPQGGVFRREGLEYVDTTTSSNPARMVGFEFNVEQTYLLVFTAGQFKVYKTDDYSSVQATVTSAPIDGITADILAEMRWTQSADTLYLFHPDLQPIKITRTSDTAWSASSVAFSNIPTFDFGSGSEAVISATRGWPRSGSFWRGRLWLGGLGSRPQTILASKVGLFEDLDEGTSLDDEAINITIDDDAVNAIVDVFAGRGFQIFTAGGEFTLRSSLDEAVTPSNAFNLLQKETLHGSGPGVNASSGTRWARPLSVDGATIFMESSGGVVRQFVFNDLEQSFNANNISILSQNILVNPTAMALRRSTQEFPNDYVYVVNSDGTVSVLNSLREQSLLAWSKFTTDGEFEDVSVAGRKTFFIVKRTIDGSTVRYIEVLNNDHFTDSSVLQNNGSATSAWSGLDHLEAETVRVRGDDYILTSEVVSSGAITSSEDVTILEAGLFFAARVRHLPIEVVIQGQSFSGQWKSPVFANIRLFESRNIVVKYEGKRQVPTFRNFGDNVLDEPVVNFSGWKKVYLGGVRRDVEIEVTQDDPLEFNILFIHFGVRV